MPLYDYQEKAVADINAAFEEGHTNIGVKMPCGSGKTWIACEIIKQKLKDGHRCLFAVNRQELVTQASDKLNQFGIDHSLITPGWRKYNPSSKVWVGTIQTLVRRPDEVKPDFVVIDEFHIVYKAYRWFLDNPDVECLGLSATPFSRGLGRLWHHLVIGPDVQTLIDAGFLVPTVVYHPFIISDKGVDINRGEYNQKQLATTVNQPKITADIVKTWKMLGEDRQTICFAVNTDHAKELANEFIDNGVCADVLDHYTKPNERKSILDRFANKKIQVICNVDILTTGYDQRDASCMIDAAHTMSLSRFMQRHGRVSRSFPGKENAIILDHAGNCLNRHGLPTDRTPDYLDTTLRPICLAEKESKVRVCPKCDVVKPRWAGRQCPVCLYEVEDRPIDSRVVVNDGILATLDSDVGKQARNEQWYGMFLWYAEFKEYKKGWASYTYKQKVGDWPSWELQQRAKPIVPNQFIANYLKYRNKKQVAKSA